MTMKATALKKLLVAGAALGVLACTVSPAAADYFELNYSTTIGSGVVYFLVPPVGNTTGGISNLMGSETTNASGVFFNSGNLQSLTGVAPLNAVKNNITNKFNDNQLVTFPANPLTPANWFSTGGLAFVAGDGTKIDIFNDGSGTLWEYAVDKNGKVAIGLDTGSSLLTDLGAPGPVPGNGLPALGMLAALALTVKARGRFAR